MVMVKKIIIVIVVIASGLMMGVILSSNLPNIIGTNSKKSSQVNTVQDSKPKELEVQLSTSPSSIQAAGQLPAVKGQTKIEKTTLTISYKNNTSSDLSGVELHIITEGGNSTGVVTVSELTKFDQNKSKDNVMVYNLPALPKKSTKKVTVGYFIRPVGDTIVKAEIRTKEGKSAISNSKIIKTF